MRTLITKIVLASVVVAAGALAPNSASAASTAKVPFSFMVGGKLCPAGTYSIERGWSGNLVILSNTDHSQSFTILIGPGEPSPAAQSVVLRFRESGDTYSLSTIQYGSKITPKMDRKGHVDEHQPERVILGQ